VNQNSKFEEPHSAVLYNHQEKYKMAAQVSAVRAWVTFTFPYGIECARSAFETTCATSCDALAPTFPLNQYPLHILYTH
jgi:hypothetical protein